MAHALEVAQSLLAGIEHKEDAGFRFEFEVDGHGRHLHDSDGVGGVVTDAGRVEAAVFLMEGQRLGVRKDHVGVAQDGAQVVRAFLHAVGEDDVERVVDVDAGGAQLLQVLLAPLRPQLLVVGGGRDAGQGTDGIQVAVPVRFQIAEDFLLYLQCF